MKSMIKSKYTKLIIILSVVLLGITILSRMYFYKNYDITAVAEVPMQVKTVSSAKYALVKSMSHEDVVRQMNGLFDETKQKNVVDDEICIPEEETGNNGHVVSHNDTYADKEDVVLAKSNEQTTTTAVTDVLNGCISAERGISSSLYNSVMLYYQTIPYGIRSAIETNGWKIVISNKSLKERFKLSQSALAITEYQSKTIYIDNRISACKSVIHEVGHVVDFLNGSISLTPSFYEVYVSEKDIFTAVWQTDSNNTATTIEYFAETFEASVINSQLMKDNCPNTYDYIAELTK